MTIRKELCKKHIQIMLEKLKFNQKHIHVLCTLLVTLQMQLPPDSSEVCNIAMALMLSLQFLTYAAMLVMCKQ